MKYRSYFKIKFELLSPLAIGASESLETDGDICLNSKNEPMIPASSIAGVYRSVMDAQLKNDYFGYVSVNEEAVMNDAKREKLVQCESKLKFYDAQLESSFGAEPIIRDCVALGENKVAIQGAKFDFQSVRTGAVFVGYIEAVSKEASHMMRELLNKPVSFGSKTTRGYGNVKISYQYKEFDLELQEDLEQWLDFHMFLHFDEEDTWYASAAKQEECMFKLVLTLKQNGGLSIRQYQTEHSMTSDYCPLFIDKIPVIPGTSWAGAFRHHIMRLLGKDYADEIDEAFGFVYETSSQKSSIYFSESRIDGAQPKMLVRNAIDRFTSGTKDGALYTEETIYGGKTKLEIRLNRNRVSDAVISALCGTIVDLNMGFAAVGGLTAVGRGLFSVTHIQMNGTEIESVDYQKLWEVFQHGA